MEKTLVIILGETRAWEKTYDNINQNVIVPLKADLCLCIGAKPEYNYDNPFYYNSKYRFLYDEPEDWGDAFNFAEYVVSNDKSDTSTNTYEEFENKNAAFAKVQNYYDNTDNIHFLGRFTSLESLMKNKKVLSNNYEEIVYHQPIFIEDKWRYCAYGIIKSDYEVCPEYQDQYGVTTMRRRKQHISAGEGKWRKFLKIKSQFLGGIRAAADSEEQHPGSAGILIFLRWFLWKNLEDTGIINEYDRFIITRSDFIWRLEHPQLELLSPDKIWVPNSEGYGGITDRHAVIPRKYMKQYCNILESMINETTGELYYKEMQKLNSTGFYFNLERVIPFHLYHSGLDDEHLGFFPYVMFSIRPANVTSRWSMGTIYREDLDSYIKYVSEYNLSQDYVNDLLEWRDEHAGEILTITDYYRDRIPASLLS